MSWFMSNSERNTND